MKIKMVVEEIENGSDESVQKMKEKYLLLKRAELKIRKISLKIR